MITATTITGTFIIDAGAFLMARVRGSNGLLITQASVSTITYAVRDLTNATTVTSGQSLAVASVVYNSLQQSDPRWDVDDAAHPGKDVAWGWNFGFSIPAAHFATFDVESTSPFKETPHRYRVTVEFFPVTGAVFRQNFEGMALPTWP